MEAWLTMRHYLTSRWNRPVMTLHVIMVVIDVLTPNTHHTTMPTRLCHCNHITQYKNPITGIKHTRFEEGCRPAYQWFILFYCVIFLRTITPHEPTMIHPESDALESIKWNVDWKKIMKNVSETCDKDNKNLGAFTPVLIAASWYATGIQRCTEYLYR